MIRQWGSCALCGQPIRDRTIDKRAEAVNCEECKEWLCPDCVVYSEEHGGTYICVECEQWFQEEEDGQENLS